MKAHPKVRYLISAGLISAIYIVAGKFCLHFAFLHPNASPIWLPSGIALTVLLVMGYGFWPSILLGAFVVNITTSGSVLSSLGIATGNTLEALSAAFLVNCFANGKQAFDRARDVLTFVFLAGFLSPAIAATVGVSSLALTGYAPWYQYVPVWTTWWLGDAGGNLIAAPFFILWSMPRKDAWNRTQIMESTFFGAALLYLGLLVFDGVIFPDVANFPLEFLCIPPIICIAYRLGQRSTATASFVLSVIALWGTMHGAGPFVRKNPNESVLLMDTFLGVISIMGLILAAVVSERQRGEVELYQAHNELEQRVRERTDSLARTVTDLRIEVAQRKQAERALHESEERLRLLIETGKEYAIFMLDPSGKIISWNAGGERITGYKAEEIIGRHFSIFFPPEEISSGKPDNELKRAVSEGRVEDVGLRVRKDGSTFWADVVITALFNKEGQLRGFAKITRWDPLESTCRHASLSIL